MDSEDANEEVVEFEDDADEGKPLGGRRLKREKEYKKKNKPGTFGTLPMPLQSPTADDAHVHRCPRVHAV